MLPICASIICYYLWLYTSLPPPGYSGAVPSDWEVQPSHFTLDSSESDPETESGNDVKKSRVPMHELQKGKGHHIKLGRSWTYNDFLLAKESMSHASGSERRGSGGKGRRGRAQTDEAQEGV